MKWLVTGANGFVGRHVVERFLRVGDGVRALVRPSTDVLRLPFHDDVDWFRGDLRRCPDLKSAFSDIDGVVHIAAAVSGSPEEQFSSTVVATENLINAMSQSETDRIILISSFSVYDWDKAGRKLDESSPLEASDLYQRDGYAIAKSWQEQVVREAATRFGWNLTVLRPGFVWGRGNEWCVGLGDVVGSKHVIIGPLRRLPLTHVVNCADCVVQCSNNPGASGQTFNVVDSGNPRAWQFAADYLARSGVSGYRIPVPYHVGLSAAKIAKGISRIAFGKQGRLPGVLVPKRYAARFKTPRFSNAKLREQIGWRPPLDYRAAVAQTYGSECVPQSFDRPMSTATEGLNV